MMNKKALKIIIVPCSRCKSWNTSPMDRKKEDWCCNHHTCGTPFRLKNHYALILHADGIVEKQDSKGRTKLRDASDDK